jgi:hypothetical protein
MALASSVLQAEMRSLRQVLRKAIVFVFAACWLILWGHALQNELSAATVLPAATAASSSPSPSRTGDLRELASLLDAYMRVGRPVLLGSRNPMENTCVPVVKSGDINGWVPGLVGDPDGGAGSRMALFYYLARSKYSKAKQDYVWHQGRLKTYLENQLVSNRPAAALARKLAEKSRQFLERISDCRTWPNDLVPVGVSKNDDWLHYCLKELDRAVASKDLSAVQRWAGELASASFSLDDIHRWFGFLVRNHLAALDFQSQCQEVFDLFDARGARYFPGETVCCLPAGFTYFSNLGNFFEIERQAERLFAMPPDLIPVLARNEYLTPHSLWVTPRLRRCFLEVQDTLSGENRQTWQKAVRTPYEHAYLLNMLYRTMATESIDELCAALKEFNTVCPRATVAELMGAMMYRGHSFGGLEWDDRYRPQLLEAANGIRATDSDQQAFLAAAQWTRDFYRSPSNYGPTQSLREALQRNKLDCIRATDMVGAIFRDAGRARFGNVRWCSETTGHSVAAYMGVENDKAKVLVADPLMPGNRLEVWPDCYFNAHAWPPGLEKNPSPYAVELYVRGLDNYVWAEGYIARGPHAGRLISAAIPYLPHHSTAGTRKVFDGPYPAEKDRR